MKHFFPLSEGEEDWGSERVGVGNMISSSSIFHYKKFDFQFSHSGHKEFRARHTEKKYEKLKNYSNLGGAACRYQK